MRKTLCYNNRVSAKRAAFNRIRRGIEVVITGLTRNQFVLTDTRVRIPPSPPKRRTVLSHGSSFSSSAGQFEPALHFCAALLFAQKKRHAHACRFSLIGERLFCSCALEGDARKDNARLGTLDAVIRAVVAGSGIAADDARVIQLLYCRVAGEIACHIGD